MNAFLLTALVTVSLNANGVIRAHSVDKSAPDFVVEAIAGENAVQLPPGQWFLTPAAPGRWGESVLVTNDTHEVSLKLLPATTLHAQIKLPDRGRVNEVSVHLQTIDAVDLSHAETRVVNCPIARDRIDCAVPAGVQDLVFRIPGYTSLYRWNQALAAPAADIGVLAFKRGATFSGRVESPLKNVAIDVELTPSSRADENDAYRARKSVAKLVTHPNARGTFVFNVTPGRYVVRASSGKLVSEEREVTVTEGREIVLREPLRLEPKRSVTINIQPPLDPWQQHWRAKLIRKNPNGVTLNERFATVPESGIVKFDDALPGWYEVSVHRSNIDTWFSTSFDVDRDVDIAAPITFTRVRGIVRLGDQPLAARVTFANNAGLHLPVKTRADGTFLTLLPSIDGDRWPIVAVDAPRVSRVFHDVALEGADTPEALVELRLKANSLRANVVDETGVPVLNALVTFVAPTGEIKQVETNNGTATLDGLASGAYKLSALAKNAESEAPVTFDLPDDGDIHDATIVVGSVTTLRGEVRSSAGPIINASLFATPAQTAPPAIVSMPVDAVGEFQLEVPAATRDIVAAVSAPGFAFRMMRIPVTRDVIEVAMDQSGGTLVIDATDNAYVVHGGVALRSHIAAYLGHGHPAGKDAYEIPDVEPGVYSLCTLTEGEALMAAHPPDRCESGTLARGGTLTLKRSKPELKAALP